MKFVGPEIDGVLWFTDPTHLPDGQETYDTLNYLLRGKLDQALTLKKSKGLSPSLFFDQQFGRPFFLYLSPYDPNKLKTEIENLKTSLSSNFPEKNIVLVNHTKDEKLRHLLSQKIKCEIKEYVPH